MYILNTAIIMRTDDFNINVVVLSRLAEMLVAGLGTSMNGMLKWITPCPLDIF
jgi:hypothetical protein